MSHLATLAWGIVLGFTCAMVYVWLDMDPGDPDEYPEVPT